MKQEDYNEKREQMSELEGQLIDKIAETGNMGLMDLFIKWQTIRLELNMNAINMMQGALDDYEKGTSLAKMCISCRHHTVAKSQEPCCDCTAKSNYIKG